MIQPQLLQSETASNESLLRSLGDLVRGLSALFWSLPLVILLGARTTLSDWLRPLGIAPSLLASGLLLFGLNRISKFRPNDPVWTALLERSKVLAVVNLGLCPFLHWWSRLPQVEFFSQMVVLLIVCGLVLLVTMNQVLARLAGMLPDETLRVETRFFSTLNGYLLGILSLMMSLYAVLAATRSFTLLLAVLDRSRDWLALFLVLLPVALTMTMVWKIKEVVLAGVFGAER